MEILRAMHSDLDNRYSLATIVLFTVVCVFFSPGISFADNISCGSLDNGDNGPYDYYKPPPHKIEVVEKGHFDARIETLKGGKNAQGPGRDLSYTLTVFPNHPRALMAMANLEFKEKTENPLGATHSVPCWFSRALQFRPEDPQVNMIYGVYLLKKGKQSDAVAYLEKSASMVKDNGNLHYNLGLAFFQIKDYEKSLQHAKRARELGYDLPGLKNKLEKLGMWQ